MATALTYPHILKRPGEPARLERLPRVRVAQLVMAYLAHGWSPDEMCRQYPHLTPAEAHSAMAYYFDHQQEIEAEVEAELSQIDREREVRSPSAFLVRMRQKGLL